MKNFLNYSESIKIDENFKLKSQEHILWSHFYGSFFLAFSLSFYWIMDDGIKKKEDHEFLLGYYLI